MVTRTNNKISRLTILFVVLVLLLSACEASNPASNDPTATVTMQKTATRTPTPAPTNTPMPTATPEWLVPLSELEEVEITFVHPWTGELQKTVNQLVDTFNQTNEYGIFVNVQATGSSQQVFQQSELALREGQGPDVVVAPIEELAYWYKLDNLVSLDGYLYDFQYGFSQEDFEDFLPIFWEQNTLDQARLGIPISGNVNFLVQNASWAKELGYDSPGQTPQQFQSQVCAARDQILNDNQWQNDGTGGWIVQQDEYTTLSWLNTYQLADFPTSETPYAFDQTATVDGFTYIRQLFDDDCAWIARDPTHYEYLVNRQALYISADVYDLDMLSKTFTRLESTDQWLLTAYPEIQGNPNVFAHGESLGILKSDPSRELASWLFIRWLSAYEQQVQLAWVNPGLPVRLNTLIDVQENRSDQWNQAASLLTEAKPAPRTSEWRVARFVLQDASYQIFLSNITPVQYPSIIAMLDSIILDLSQQPASIGWE